VGKWNMKNFVDNFCKVLAGSVLWRYLILAVGLSIIFCECIDIGTNPIPLHL
jgi:hypothetical protein